MIRFIHYILFGFIVLHSVNGISQDTNRVQLHIQFYDNGVSTPMLKSPRYSTSMYQKTKSVLLSSSYYSTLYAAINSTDSADLKIKENHKLQSSSLRLDPKLDYELVVLSYNGFDLNHPDSMVIKISKLSSDAQLTLPFKKGKFKLEKMKYFKKIEKNASPDFSSAIDLNINNTLKRDSISYFENGKIKAKYYKIASNFPLYFVQEFDPENPKNYAQGYRLITNYSFAGIPLQKSVWTNPDMTKYGYWEYFEDGVRVKHERWASILQERYEWYPSGELKVDAQYGQYNKSTYYLHYLENGDIKEEFRSQTATLVPFLKCYNYSTEGKVILINTYNSSNGITKQGLQKRELFYPSGQVKMEENYVGTYTIKYYNEDGTPKIN